MWLLLSFFPPEVKKERKKERKTLTDDPEANSRRYTALAYSFPNLENWNSFPSSLFHVQL